MWLIVFILNQIPVHDTSAGIHFTKMDKSISAKSGSRGTTCAIASVVYENLQTSTTSTTSTSSSPPVYSLLDNMSFTEYFAKFGIRPEPSMRQATGRLSLLSSLYTAYSNSSNSSSDKYENVYPLNSQPILERASVIYEDCDLLSHRSVVTTSAATIVLDEAHYSVPKCSAPVGPPPPVPQSSELMIIDREIGQETFSNSTELPRHEGQNPADSEVSEDSGVQSCRFRLNVSPVSEIEEVLDFNPSEKSNEAEVEKIPRAEIVNSLHDIISVEPVLHVIDLPPQKIGQIRRRRSQYTKSSRLSQFMSAEFKVNPPNNNHGINTMNRFGNVFRRKVGGWVRKIQSDEVDIGVSSSSSTSPATSNASDSSEPRDSSTIKRNLKPKRAEVSQKIPPPPPEDQVQNFGFDGHLGQNEFEDLRKLVKQGGDFCKDLATVLQERAELEAQYSKGLAKLSSKLLKASKEATGTVAHAWQAVAVQIDTQAELHRCWSSVLQDELAKPLKSSTDTQSKIRKSVEALVDKTTRNLAEWRTAETKAKRQCFSSSKEFEKLQDAVPNGEIKSRLLSAPPTDPIKMEAKKRKAEETVRRADIEYYTFCVRSERARLEWESSIRNGSTCLRTLEEEKLTLLRDLAFKYFDSMNDITPKLVRSTEVLEEPIKTCSVDQDMQPIVVRRHACSEQLLPDFYAEDSSTLMKSDRRREVLQKCLFLITQDLDRERKGTIGVENLARAIADSTKIDNTQNDVSDKLYYMKSMLLYLEAARTKLEVAMADIEGKPKPVTQMAKYMRHQRDKQGLPQTILKVPSWARDDCLTPSPTSESPPNWPGPKQRDNEVSNHSDGHDTDFDEFSSEAGSSDNVFDEDKDDVPSIGKCRVLYDYDKNLFDELTIRAGDIIKIHDKQEDGWWLGELKGTIGIFPATYAEEIEEPSASPLSESSQ